MNETTLLQLVRNGETDAYRGLVERYQTGLIIYCDRLVTDRDTAEDIAQEAFVRAYYSLQKFDETKGSFSTWLYRIAANIAKDYLRKHKRKRPLADADMVADEIPALTSSEISEIQTVVRNLDPPEYSRVIQAYYWEGKRYEDIASEMNVPKATIGTWLMRAKGQLRKELS